MDILQRSHCEDGDDAKRDLDDKRAAGGLVGAFDALAGNDGAVTGELVEGGGELFAFRVDAIVDLVEFGIGRALFDERLEIHLNGLAKRADIGIVALQQVAGLQLLCDHAYFLRAAGEGCQRIGNDLQAVGLDDLLFPVDDRVHGGENQRQIGDAHVVDDVDALLDLVSAAQAGIDLRVLVPADAEHRAEADESSPAERPEPLADRKVSANRRICHKATLRPRRFLVPSILC